MSRSIQRMHAEITSAADDPTTAARTAGLRYTTDARPGIRRRRAGRHFSYIGLDGKPIHDEPTLKRIKSLAVPPAWTDVWISPIANGHLQATGRDARGRKQYRYHPRWREVRDETKFHRMLAFGLALPAIRDRVDHDLALPSFPREKVLATVVRLLETTLIRVGNEEYVRQNGSYGLTTLRNRHVRVEGSTLRFHFTGKSGITHVVGVKDRRLASIVRRLRDLPGHHLFQYVDENNEELQAVESEDVNEYLREITGQDFTAKDFRTWAGTLLAARALDRCGCADSEAQAKGAVVRALEEVAQQMGNTPAVCRKCYVHPAVVDAYLGGTTIGTLMEHTSKSLKQKLSNLDPDEAGLMVLLSESQGA